VDELLQKLREQVETATAALREKGYAAKTIEDYSGVWRQLLRHAERQCIGDPGGLLTQFAMLKYGIRDISHPADTREKYYARFLLCLQDASTNAPWITKRSYKAARQFRSRGFEGAYDNFAAWLNGKPLKQASIALMMQSIRAFLCFAEDHQLNCISELSQTTVLQYLESKCHLSKPTKDSMVNTIREFFRCPEVAKMIGKDLSVNLKSRKTSRYYRLPSFFSTEEIRRTLTAIDRNTLEGKKDFAVILMAVDTGLRVSDIINLRLSNLKWDCQEIGIVQQKTGQPLRLWMTDALKWALLDYMMNSRPKDAPYDHVFLRSLAPFHPYVSAGHYYKRLNKYLDLAGVDTTGRRHGMHSLRHSLAARLMGENVPITIISEALGHKYANVTMQYVRIDIEKLRLAALEIAYNA